MSVQRSSSAAPQNQNINSALGYVPKLSSVSKIQVINNSVNQLAKHEAIIAPKNSVYAHVPTLVESLSNVVANSKTQHDAAMAPNNSSTTARKFKQFLPPEKCESELDRVFKVKRNVYIFTTSFIFYEVIQFYRPFIGKIFFSKNVFLICRKCPIVPIL